jgi:hypothetical protein
MPSAFLRYQFQIKVYSIVYMFIFEHTLYAHLLLLLFSIELLFYSAFLRVAVLTIDDDDDECRCNSGDRIGQLDVSK